MIRIKYKIKQDCSSSRPDSTTESNCICKLIPQPKSHKQHILNTPSSTSPIISAPPMASKLSTVALVATLVVAVFMACASAQSGCTTAIIGLAPCLSYITGNSTTPSGNCCSQLASIVKSEPQCLCTVLNGGASQYGLSINQTQALALPGACSVKTPSVSQCNSVAGPAASPTAPGNSPTTSSATEGRGSKATPGDSTSAGSTAKMTFSLGFFFLFVLVSCA